jgi:DNA-binding NarL/FixJ family response regulator
VHTGEVEIHEDTVAGLALHVTARIAARAKAREVLVYGIVSDLAAGSGLYFVERGTMSIDGVKGELRALSVAPERHLEPVTAHGADLGTLSAREREVLGLVAEGMSTAAIDRRDLLERQVEHVMEHEGDAFRRR